MARWWRFYTDAHRHHKIRSLNNSEFRFWTELLSLASEIGDNGRLGTAQTIAKLQHKRLRNCQETIEKLSKLLLIEHTNGCYFIHNWAAKQYTSDQSTQRVRAFRGRYRNVSETVNETPPDYRKKDRLQTRNVSSETQTASVGRSRDALPPSAEASNVVNGHDPRFGQYHFKHEENYRSPPRPRISKAEVDAMYGKTVPAQDTEKVEEEEIPF